MYNNAERINNVIIMTLNSRLTFSIHLSNKFDSRRSSNKLVKSAVDLPELQCD